MANERNLISADKRTKSELREMTRKGGIASGKARRERKAFRETLDILLSMPLDDKKIDELERIKAFKGIKGKNVTVQEAILITQIQKALKGDFKAAQFVIELLGEAVSNNTNTQEDELSKSLRELAEGLESD